MRPPRTLPSTENQLLNPFGTTKTRAPSDASQSNGELGIIRSFEFVSSLRRMSVIVKRLDGNVMTAFVKGAPEVIADICNPATIPTDYTEILGFYTHKGYRVLACAYRPLPNLSWMKAQKIKRDAVECDLNFLGLIVFENKLKRETTGVLDVLSRANIRQVICTGDNLLTAVSVGRECGLLHGNSLVYAPRMEPASDQQNPMTLIWECIDNPELKLDATLLTPMVAQNSVASSTSNSLAATLNDIRITRLSRRTDCGSDAVLDIHTADSSNFDLAITGDCFEYMIQHSPIDTINQLLLKGTIYARMSPDQKLELVERLQGIEYCVGMCGDGANDCGALKAADVGISLSEAEASVAAPFTSRISNIECVLKVIREGRCALVTSFSCFKFIALYSMIQFTSVSLMYLIVGNLGDLQYLYIDLFIILPIAVCMGRSEAYAKIHPKRPTANLTSRKVIMVRI